MLCQFDEHENLCQSSDERVQRLAKMAEKCGVLIHIDGMPYGSQRLLRERGIIGSAERQSNQASRTLTGVAFGSPTPDPAP